MVEIELKFQLPEKQKKAVERAFKKVKARQIQLHAKYYDTSDRILSQHGVAIRLRLEGENWIQTLKAAGESHLHRIEEEIFLGKCEQPPDLNLDLYQHNRSVQTLLTEILGDQKDQLALQFETIVQRTFHVFELHGSLIEACLDDGEIRSSQTHQKICEVEFELKSGDAGTLIDFSQSWVEQYQLWLDVRSKAERGSLLAAGKTVSPATHAKSFVLDKQLSPEIALQKMVINCLNHLLPNLAAIAGDVAEPEHIHQARVALRRLRSLLKNFGKWSAYVNPEWEAELAALFRQLGTTRDLDVITLEILPRIQQQNDAPVLQIDSETQVVEDSSVVFRQPSTTKLLLKLLEFSYRQPRQSKQKNVSLKHVVSKRLDHLHHQLRHDAKHFADMDAEARHRTRKRVKKLRYIIEFVATIYPPKQVEKYLKYLQKVQNHLGTYNDLVIAAQYFSQQVQQNPEFNFALTWVDVEQKNVLVKVEKNLLKFSQLKGFWE
ncbi:MAG: CYTH and CHAD domain-containing protein [Acinetobacter populi]|uniref:CYTH and CHAD domain-containing protein n=1 Tax=Acinetobacter populi TaxID=1582270 RepID=UPI002352E324|nr:CYTH and CHAD domain-containing protein [Acinetobacter populi]MCH4248341.1 CYTH and CHAD domain-containing protein [Acinetobacter populi]